jgi:hypothetical protein
MITLVYAQTSAAAAQMLLVFCGLVWSVLTLWITPR